MAQLIELSPQDGEYRQTMLQMQQTIVHHKSEIKLRGFNFQKIYRVNNPELQFRFNRRRSEIEMEMGAGEECEVISAYHGSPAALAIIEEGFKVSKSRGRRMFGKGIYVAKHSSKANQYTFTRTGCAQHSSDICTQCTRRILICKCLMGRKYIPSRAMRSIPPGYHSVKADPTTNLHLRNQLAYTEYCLLTDDQVLPWILVEYKMDRSTDNGPEDERLYNEMGLASFPRRRFLRFP